MATKRQSPTTTATFTQHPLTQEFTALHNENAPIANIKRMLSTKRSDGKQYAKVKLINNDIIWLHYEQIPSTIIVKYLLNRYERLKNRRSKLHNKS